MIDEETVRERIHRAVGYEPPSPSFGTRPITDLPGSSRPQPLGKSHAAWMGAVAALLAVVAVGTLTLGLRAVRMNHTAPAAVQTHSPSPRSTFTPSPAVRASNWPAGQPVPAQLAGSWQSQFGSRRIDLSGFTDQLTDSSRCIPGTGFPVGVCGYGNVVVNGNAIYFVTDTCFAPASQLTGQFGYEEYTYSLTGDSLVLVKADDPGQSVCGFYLQGTYKRIATS